MTNIEWTDETWNPLAGCSIVSPGCTNCYAMKMAHRIEGMNEALGRKTHYAGLTKKTKAGAVWTGKMAVAPDHILTLPLRWKKPRRIFVNSMSDLFHEDVADEAIDRVFAVMALAQQHTFQVLTKRADRMRQYFERWPQGAARFHHVAHEARKIRPGLPDGINGWTWELQRRWPLPNVWLGVSIEDRERMRERASALALTPAAVRFWSAEPLLEDLGDFQFVQHFVTAAGSPRAVDQIIVGGESGPRSRSFKLSWAEMIQHQCADYGIPFFLKQLGAEAYDDRSYVGSSPRYETKDRKGGDPEEWPADLRVREMPT